MMKVQLVSPLPDHGFAYNQAIYWPVGLLTIASYLKRETPEIDVEILDEAILGRACLATRLTASVVGIQASSSLTYGGVLRIARLAKRSGALVVVGGPFATEVPEKILSLRNSVDIVVTGSGEEPMLRIVEALLRRPATKIPARIPGAWYRMGGKIVPPSKIPIFNYERSRPLNYDFLPVETYHRNYRLRMHPDFRGSFQIFTHFGCRYREMRRRAKKAWCSYCALSGILSVRNPQLIRDEIRETLVSAGIPSGSRVMLKCYGDNASALGRHLEALATILEKDIVLRQFDLHWSLYGQSSFITTRLVEILKRLNVFELYVGFDSADNEIQRRNSLGTSRASHLRAAQLLRDAGIRLHAGFVLGCLGETPESLDSTVTFAQELSTLGNVDMYHASPLVVLPGSPAFRLLSREVPSLAETDFHDTVTLQLQWLAHFCPALGNSFRALEVLESAARTISNLGRLPSSFGGWRERKYLPETSRPAKHSRRTSQVVQPESFQVQATTVPSDSSRCRDTLPIGSLPSIGLVNPPSQTLKVIRRNK